MKHVVIRLEEKLQTWTGDFGGLGAPWYLASVYKTFDRLIVITFDIP
jgi:hypothetical protein